MKRIVDKLFQLFLRKSNSRLVAKIAVQLSQFLGKPGSPSYIVRRAVDLAQLRDPLARMGNAFPPIDIVTVTAPDTFDFADTSIRAAIATSGNPIRSVTAIVPDYALDRARREIPSADVVAESQVLPDEIFRALERFESIGRDKWVLCQVLGMYFARNSDSAGVLVVDADTFILEKRRWLDSSGRQVLAFSHEYHPPYEDHCKAIFGPRTKHHGLSYVTHYMLMQPEILKDIFPSDHSFIEWIMAADPGVQSGLADYHTYGRWMVENRGEQVVLATWDNARFVWPYRPGEVPSDAIAHVREKNLGFHSVSSHRYLER